MSYIDYTFETVDGEETLVCTRPVIGTTIETVFTLPKSVFVECFNRWCSDGINSSPAAMQTNKNCTFELRGLHLTACGGSWLIDRGHASIPVQIAMSAEMCFGHSDIFKPCEYSSKCLSARQLLRMQDRPDGIICSIYAPEEGTCKCLRDDTTEV